MYKKRQLAEGKTSLSVFLLRAAGIQSVSGAVIFDPVGWCSERCQLRCKKSRTSTNLGEVLPVLITACKYKYEVMLLAQYMKYASRSNPDIQIIGLRY